MGVAHQDLNGARFPSALDGRDDLFGEELPEPLVFETVRSELFVCNCTGHPLHVGRDVDLKTGLLRSRISSKR